jgi:putative tryptophan/tyrosine transport system substrate-binding protein
MIARRTFIAGLGAAAGSSVIWPLAARAQQGERVRRLGFLTGLAEDDIQLQPFLAAFKQGLQELGWIDGRNIKVDYRFGADRPERVRMLAKELVDEQPDVLVGHATPITAALTAATKNIPIVFIVVSDPVGSGFVTSLAHPGGNLTGFINIESSMVGKWLEFLKEVSPGLTRAAFFYNPETAPYSYYLGPFEEAARSLGVQPLASPARSVEEVEATIAKLGESPNSGLITMPDIFFTTRRVYEPLVAAANLHRIPAIYPYRYQAAAGGLMSYGTDNTDLFHRAPSYIDRILKGDKPGDLPVQLPTKFEFVVNLKTAKALGLEIPLKLRAFADEVIE